MARHKGRRRAVLSIRDHSFPSGAQAPLWAALLQQAPLMQFYRFCELLERSMPHHAPLGTSDSPADEPVRFRSRAALGFPGREIDTVEIDTDDTTRPPVIRTTFLGLYGIDARMPSYFVDEIAQNHEGAEPLAAFLDIFHHRFITQYYRIWRKYRYPVGFHADGSDPVSTYLLSFAGFGLGPASFSETVDPRKLLSMLGLINQKTRTAEGLAGVLRHAVPDADIAIEEFHPVWVSVESNEPMPLGEYCVLGGGFYDRSSCVRIVITPSLASSVGDLMPGGPMHKAVIELLRLYLGYEAQAVVTMHVHPRLISAATLETRRISLGYTSLLAPQGTHKDGDDRLIRISLAAWNRPALV